MAEIVAAGAGLTVTEAVTGAPLQPFTTGIMVNVTVIGALLVLFNVPAMLPDPDEAIPVTVAVLLRVQLKTVPGTLPVMTIGVIGL